MTMQKLFLNLYGRGLVGIFGVCVLAVASGPTAAQDKQATPDKKNWSVSASAGAQYDDNVTTNETDSTSNQSDRAWVFEASGIYSPPNGQAYGLELGLDFYKSLYDDQTDFNLDTLTLSVSVEREINEIDTGLIYLLTQTLLGAESLLVLHSLSPTAGFAATPSWYVSGRYNFQAKNFSTDNDRDSTVHSVAVENFFLFMENKAYVSLGYRAEGENAQAAQFDYFGHFFHARLKTPIPVKQVEQWNPVLTLSYEYSKKDFSSVTASIGNEREDTRATITLGLSADVTERVFAKFDYERIEAVSNLSSSDFDENVFTFSLGAKF